MKFKYFRWYKFTIESVLMWSNGCLDTSAYCMQKILNHKQFILYFKKSAQENFTIDTFFLKFQLSLEWLKIWRYFYEYAIFYEEDHYQIYFLKIVYFSVRFLPFDSSKVSHADNFYLSKRGCILTVWLIHLRLFQGFYIVLTIRGYLKSVLEFTPWINIKRNLLTKCVRFVVVNNFSIKIKTFSLFCHRIIFDLSLIM